MADYVSVLTGGSNNFATTSEHLNALATDILEEGVVGSVGNTAGVAPATGGLACNAQGTPNMTVAVTAGYCYVTATPSGQSSQMLRANIAAQNATIAANSTGGTRYDWIYVTISAANAANPAAAGDNVASITVSRSTSSSTDNGTPPTYGYPIAVVTVANGASSITNGNIADLRGSVSVVNNSTTTGWTSLGDSPDTVAYNGNRNYTFTFSGADVSDTISPGMKLKLTRATTAPTQCADLESGSSNYFNKTSPNKLTFTDDFVCSAWIKLESYAAMTIMSRYNGTSGWKFSLTSSGQIEMYGYNAGAANYSGVVSTASVPLNKWVHVAAQLDMSTFTATTTTSYVMFDGLNVTASVNRGGTNPTALVQAGSLEVGGQNGGTAPFDGKLAQVAVFNAKVPQATMLTYISQGLSGSETSLASAYSLSNSITDLNTTTPNDLTAQNSAVATATDSPFAARSELATGVTAGTTEYAEVTSVSYSSDTTVTARVPESCLIPTSGGVSATYYSSYERPFGLPYFSKILGIAMMLNSMTVSSATDTLAGGLSITVVVPTNSRVKVYVVGGAHYNPTAGEVSTLKIWDGAVTSGTQIGENITGTGASTYSFTSANAVSTVLASGSKTYNASLRYGASGTAHIDCTTTRPCYLIAELV